MIKDGDIIKISRMQDILKAPRETLLFKFKLRQSPVVVIGQRLPGGYRSLSGSGHHFFGSWS